MKILLFSARYSGSGSPIRAGLIAKGLKLAGAEVAVAGYSIPDDLQNLVKAYVFQSDRSGGDYLVEAALDFKPDWIYGITDDQAAWVINASRQAKCKAAFDLHGIGAFEAIDLGKAYSNRMRRIRQSLTNLRNVGKAQFMTTCTPNMYKLARILWGGARVADFTGMVDSATFLNNLQERPAPVSTGEKVNVFYIGNYYRWQGVGILLDAIKIVKSQCDRFEFSILGSAGKDQAPELTNHSAIRDGMVTILDSVPHA